MKPDKYNQGLSHYPLMISLDRYDGRYNALDDPSNRIRVPNKTEDAYLNVFSMITGTNESKIWLKRILVTVNVSFMVENPIQNKNGITIKQ